MSKIEFLQQLSIKARFKAVFLTLTLLITSVSFSQKCGTDLPANYAAQRTKYNQLTAASSTLLPHDTCFNKKLSVVFYVFLDSTGNPGVTPAQITGCINNLNKYFKPVCIKFESCSTKYIPQHEYNKWDKPNHEFKMVGNAYNYFTPKTINIYLVNFILNPGENAYTYMPGVPGDKDLIVMRKAVIGGMDAIHVMGHFFGLSHTFAEISTNLPDGPSSELVLRTNCQTNGDGFCDTSADPWPTGSAPAICDFVYGPKDAGLQYYVPPVDNIMSHWTCRCRFTQEQYNYMAYTYIYFRNYLH